MPLHHRLLPRSKSCLAMFPNPTVPTLRNPTSDSRHTFHPLPTHIPSLSLCTFHPFVVTTLALSNSSHLTSMACVLKRFPFASPRKLSLPCVKRGFLRTAEPHRNSQLSPCAPLCRSAMSMRCLAGRRHAPAPPHHRLLPRSNSCLALFSNPTAPTLRNPTSHSHPAQSHISLPTHFPSSPYSHSLTLPTH